jgi:PEP-CTERM motif-containing protein
LALVGEMRLTYDIVRALTGPRCDSAKGLRLMGIRFRSVGIAIGALLALIVVRPAKADSFNFSFTPNQTMCSQYINAGSCDHFGSGTFTTDPLTYNFIYNTPAAYPVNSIDGALDGFTMSILFLSGVYPGSIPGPGTRVSFSPGPIFFIANGQQWGFARADLPTPWQDFLVNYTANTMEPINLTIQTPEPSTLLLMSVGLIGLMGLTLLKNRLS